jgi:hypothetical protein
MTTRKIDARQTMFLGSFALFGMGALVAHQLPAPEPGQGGGAGENLASLLEAQLAARELLDRRNAPRT